MQVLTVPRRAGPAPVPAAVVENTPPKLLARSSSPGPQAASVDSSLPEAANAAAPAPDPGLPRLPCLLPCQPPPQTSHLLACRQKCDGIPEALVRAGRLSWVGSACCAEGPGDMWAG